MGGYGLGCSTFLWGAPVAAVGAGGLGRMVTGGVVCSGKGEYDCLSRLSLF